MHILHSETDGTVAVVANESSILKAVKGHYCLKRAFFVRNQSNDSFLIKCYEDNGDSWTGVFKLYPVSIYQ